MPLPVRSLTVLQNWDCAGCSACCRQYHVPVTQAERERIEAFRWEKDSDLAGATYFVRSGGRFSSEYRLNHKPDGACVFLGTDNRCRIHARHGSAAKPLACRIYPYSLVPAGDHWNLGLRFSCPTAANDQGKPLAEHLSEAREFAALLEVQAGPRLAEMPAPPLQKSQPVAWSDLSRIITAVSKLLANAGDAPERRCRRVLFIVALLRKTRFDGRGQSEKAVTGGRLSELLHILGAASADEVPQSPDDVPPPGWVGRTVFRPLAALYARKDHGAERGTAQGSAFGRMSAAMQFRAARASFHASTPPSERLHSPMPSSRSRRFPIGPCRS